MKFPKRLLELGGEEGRIARQVVEDESFEPPSGAKERVWAGIAPKIGPSGPGAGAPSIGPAATGAGGLLSTIGLVVVIGASAIGVGYWALSDSHKAAETTVEAPTAAPDPPLAAQPATPIATPDSERVPELGPSEPAPHARAARSQPAIATAEPTPATSGPSVGALPPPDPKTSALLKESALVSRVRSALRSGDVRGASQLLGQLDREFPRGGLMQEREALSIELIWQSGQRKLASERAKAFVRAYPSSPHAARLRAFTQPD